jgi:hypothetical protein
MEISDDPMLKQERVVAAQYGHSWPMASPYNERDELRTTIGLAALIAGANDIRR